MPELRQLLLLTTWLLLTSGLNQTLAQTPITQSVPKTNEQEPQIRIVTNEVRLPLRAFDPLGKPVTDLTAKEIVVLEDGVSCPVTSLKLEPANVMLILDLSNTLGTFKSGRAEPQKEVVDNTNYSVIARPLAFEFAESLVRQLAAPDHLAILQYADRVELLQDWTRNHAEALNALRAKFRPGLKARFYDALAMAAARLPAAPAGRRVLVLVTDGIDTASVAAKQLAMAQVMDSGASIFVISWAELVLGEAQRLLKKKRFSTETSQTKQGTQISSDILSPATFKSAGEIKRYTKQAHEAAEDLKTLAVESGGEYWLPTISSEFSAQPRALMREIGSQYTLTYLSKKDQIDRATSMPEVRLARPGLTARTRQAAKSQR
jgi:VWFA-related protein